MHTPSLASSALERFSILFQFQWTLDELTMQYTKSWTRSSEKDALVIHLVKIGVRFPIS